MEVMVVLVIVGLLVSVISVSLVAVRQRGRNAQRSADVSSILNAVYQYALDNNNQLPPTITTATTSICQTGAASCTGLIDLSVLTNSQKYLTNVPVDPSCTSTTDTKYSILKNANNRVTIVALNAEANVTVSITR